MNPGVLPWLWNLDVWSCVFSWDRPEERLLWAPVWCCSHLSLPQFWFIVCHSRTSRLSPFHEHLKGIKSPGTLKRVLEHPLFAKPFWSYREGGRHILSEGEEQLLTSSSQCLQYSAIPFSLVRFFNFQAGPTWWLPLILMGFWMTPSSIQVFPSGFVGVRLFSCCCSWDLPLFSSTCVKPDNLPSRSWIFCCLFLGKDVIPESAQQFLLDRQSIFGNDLISLPENSSLYVPSENIASYMSSVGVQGDIPLNLSSSMDNSQWFSFQETTTPSQPSTHPQLWM